MVCNLHCWVYLSCLVSFIETVSVECLQMSFVILVHFHKNIWHYMEIWLVDLIFYTVGDKVMLHYESDNLPVVETDLALKTPCFRCENWQKLENKKVQKRSKTKHEKDRKSPASSWVLFVCLKIFAWHFFWNCVTCHCAETTVTYGKLRRFSVFICKQLSTGDVIADQVFPNSKTSTLGSLS